MLTSFLNSKELRANNCTLPKTTCSPLYCY